MIKELKSPQAQAFITLHEVDNPSELALKYAQKTELPMQLMVSQIKSRQKAKNKLPTWLKTEGIIFPHGVPMEQCSSEQTAEYKAGLIQGKSLVDLTGGTGIDTYYLSKHFEQTIYVEQNADLCELAEHNFSVLKSNISVENKEAEVYLKDSKMQPGWFYLDPARRDKTNKKVFKVSDCQPDLTELLPLLLAKNANVLVKFSPMLDIKEVIRTLPNIESVHVVSVDNECKEVLLVIKNGFEGEIKINAVNIHKETQDHFNFTYESEAQAVPNFSQPKQYLYEPNVSVLKAGGFKSIASYFKLDKINRNSHLYTSEELIKDFHGRTFKIIATIPASPKFLKPFLTKGQANLAVRNFPLTTNQLSKKLKLKDGGDTYIFATTILGEKHRLIVCEKC